MVSDRPGAHQIRGGVARVPAPQGKDEEDREGDEAKPQDLIFAPN